MSILQLLYTPIAAANMTIIAVLFVPVFIELGVSWYRRDEMYSVAGTLGNALSTIIGRLFVYRFVSLYLGYIVLWQIGHALSLQALPDTPLVFALCFVCEDLIYYGVHRLHHRFEFLWMFHHTHHSDEKLNLSTGLRISWFEQSYQPLFFVPLLFLGFSPLVVLTCFSWLAVFQLFIHEQYLQAPRFFEYVFITPRTHRVHHDQEIRHQASNLGAVFSVWDRLFGTYVPGIEHFTPGIKGYHENNPLKFQTDPVIETLKRNFTKRG